MTSIRPATSADLPALLALEAAAFGPEDRFARLYFIAAHPAHAGKGVGAALIAACQAETAARLIGTGLYGVDIKENDKGVYVIEINDNPNLEAGVEGAILKDELWAAIIRWFSERLEARIAPDGV